MRDAEVNSADSEQSHAGPPESSFLGNVPELCFCQHAQFKSFCDEVAAPSRKGCSTENMEEHKQHLVTLQIQYLHGPMRHAFVRAAHDMLSKGCSLESQFTTWHWGP